VTYSYILNTAFRDAWEKADEPCDKRRMLVNELVMGAPIESKLKPMTVAAPPTTKDITQLFQHRKSKQAEVEL
jgi:Lon protease-like protein